MKSTTSASRHRALPAVSTLVAVLLASLVTPVWANSPCVNPNGTPDDETPFTDLGNEHGGNASGFSNTNTTCHGLTSAYGIGNNASGLRSNAIGIYNTASGFVSSVLGTHSIARGAGSLAVGGWYDRDGDGTVTMNVETAHAYDSNETAAALGLNSVAIGAGVMAYADASFAAGVDSAAHGFQSSAVGMGNSALGQRDAALGTGNTAGEADPFAFSGNNAALGVENVATGGSYLNFSGEPTSTSAALGVRNQATGTNSSALGVDNVASAWNSTAIGNSSVASADHSTAIGSHSVADRENTLSVGAVGAERQIVNVADASEDTDAVNLSQLYPLATALGGGASYAGGIFTAPTYIIQSSNYNNIGSAFTAVDSALTDINQRISNAGGIQGERGLSAYEVAVSNGFAGTEGDWLQSLNGPQGPSGPTGPEGPAGGGPRSVTYDSDTRDVLTMAGADGTRIANVADAVEATDAVNLGQMEAGDAGTLTAANEYTDNTATETLSSANAYTDQRFAEITGLSDSFESFRNDTDRRFQQQDRRIDKLSAMSGAYAGMAMNTSGLAGRNRIGVGVGAQGGEQALAVGYQRAIGNRASVSIAGAFSGDEKSVSAGAGFSW